MRTFTIGLRKRPTKTRELRIWRSSESLGLMLHGNREDRTNRELVRSYRNGIRA